MNSLNVKQVFRNLRKNKFYSFITIFGLAVGMAVTILLYIYTQHEFSFDRFNVKSKRIYRINSILLDNSKNIYPICLRLGDSTLQKQVPEIEDLCQIYNEGETEFISENVRYKNIPFIYADPNIHKVFTVNYLRGNSDNALMTPGSLVLTRSIAVKIFGSIDVVGKTLTESNTLYTVSGVIEDFPSTSHLKLGAIAPLKFMPYLQYMGGLEFGTYVLFNANSNIDQGVKKAEESYRNLLNQKFGPSGYKMDCFLQKLTDIHLKSDFQSKSGFDASLKKIYIYIALALVVLLIAIINFINLLTAQYEGKSKEIGVQKAIGASRMHIAKQFMGKSIIFSFIALVIACIMVEFLMPSFGRLLHRDLVSTYRKSFSLFLTLPILAVIVGFISGFYPALFISKFSPYLAIKGVMPDKKGTNGFTKVLVVFQFSIAIFLISSLFVINRQVNYMKTADLGFNSEKVVAVRNLNDKINKSYPSIKDVLLKIPEIKSIGASHHLIGGGVSGQGLDVVGQTPPKHYPINEYRVRPGFFETLGFKFIMGRPYDENVVSDQLGIILNETAVKTLGISDPMSTELFFHEEKYHIVGVVKDFHYASLEESIDPIMFTYTNRINYIMLKIDNKSYREVLSKVEKVLKDFDSGYLLDYLMLDDFCRNKYGAQEQTEKMSSYTTILSLLLALLGLYAMAMFMVQKRTKEIGIRKVNGASRIQIVKLLLMVYTRQVAIAFVIAAPIAYFVLRGWLNDFAYRIELTPTPFIIAGLLALAVALITVAGQTWRAAGRNPVLALKHE